MTAKEEHEENPTKLQKEEDELNQGEEKDPIEEIKELYNDEIAKLYDRKYALLQQIAALENNVSALLWNIKISS
jgi:hypothetical protein